MQPQLQGAEEDAELDRLRRERAVHLWKRQDCARAALASGYGRLADVSATQATVRTPPVLRIAAVLITNLWLCPRTA
jgi:hypothetical protein